MILRVVSRKFPDDLWDGYVGRSGARNVRSVPPEKRFTQFGNVFKDADWRERYREHLRAHPEIVEEARRLLAGMTTLACWCAPKGGVDVDSKVALPRANPRPSDARGG